MKQKFKFEPRWFAIIVFFFCGIFIGGFIFFTWIFNGGSFFGIKKIHSNASNAYKFINPLIAVENEQVSDFFVNQALQNKLASIIEDHRRSLDIQQAAVYFRDVDPGRWVGINEDVQFSPGKLLKMPLMMAYFKAAETDPKILEKKLVHHTDPADTSVGNQVDLVDGQSYSVLELIKDMIIDDDDGSANLLYDNIDHQALDEVFSDLGINFKEDKKTDDYITVKQYSLFFRVLYNATYLNRDYSEQALDILSQTPNTDGIAIGLPNDLVVANKYRTRDFGKGLVESHDCGIIYYPGHPYLLCAMGIGKSEESINKVFKDVSQVVYKDMTQKYKN